MDKIKNLIKFSKLTCPICDEEVSSYWYIYNCEEKEVKELLNSTNPLNLQNKSISFDGYAPRKGNGFILFKNNEENDMCKSCNTLIYEGFFGLSYITNIVHGLKQFLKSHETKLDWENWDLFNIATLLYTYRSNSYEISISKIRLNNKWESGEDIMLAIKDIAGFIYVLKCLNKIHNESNSKVIKFPNEVEDMLLNM